MAGCRSIRELSRWPWSCSYFRKGLCYLALPQIGERARGVSGGCSLTQVSRLATCLFLPTKTGIKVTPGSLPSLDTVLFAQGGGGLFENLGIGPLIDRSAAGGPKGGTFAMGVEVLDQPDQR